VQPSAHGVVQIVSVGHLDLEGWWQPYAKGSRYPNKGPRPRKGSQRSGPVCPGNLTRSDLLELVGRQPCAARRPA
jgi:hypothetical protein